MYMCVPILVCGCGSRVWTAQARADAVRGVIKEYRDKRSRLVDSKKDAAEGDMDDLEKRIEAMDAVIDAEVCVCGGMLLRSCGCTRGVVLLRSCGYVVALVCCFTRVGV